MKPKVLVMAGYGINSEQETAHAFNLVGGQAEVVHINDLISGKKKMADYHIMCFPGGFAYGDDTGAGAAYANKLKNNLWGDLMQFIDTGKLILGICNGFQIVTALGIFALQSTEYGKRINALLHNSSSRFVCRYVHIKANSESNCIFTKGIDKLYIPVSHGEGRFFCDDKVLKELTANNQIVFTYCDENSSSADGAWPYNPNGSLADIAGICDKTGRIMSLMPHPERAVYPCNEPDFHLKKEIARREGRKVPELLEQNLKIFKNAVEYFGRALVPSKPI